ADGLLNRHRRVETRGTVNIDIVGAQPAERISEETLHSGRPPVIAEPIANSIAQRSELDADHHRGAVAAPKRLVDQHLVVAHAVEIAGVEQSDAGVERGVDGGDALAAVSGAVEVRHAHSSEADGRDLGTLGTKLAMDHGITAP